MRKSGIYFYGEKSCLPLKLYQKSLYGSFSFWTGDFKGTGSMCKYNSCSPELHTIACLHAQACTQTPAPIHELSLIYSALALCRSGTSHQINTQI